MKAVPPTSVDPDEEIKREKRRAANRRSARKSRYREVVMMEELQRDVKRLTNRNEELKLENGQLRDALKSFKEKQSTVRSITHMVRT